MPLVIFGCYLAVRPPRYIIGQEQNLFMKTLIKFSSSYSVVSLEFELPQKKFIVHAWHFCTRNCRFKMSRFFSQPCRIFWSLVTNLILEKFPKFIEIILVRVFLHGNLRAIGRLRVSRGSK